MMVGRVAGPAHTKEVGRDCRELANAHSELLGCRQNAMEQSQSAQSHLRDWQHITATLEPTDGACGLLRLLTELSEGPTR